MGLSQTRDELLEHLREQLQFIQLSMNSYDNGFEGEAKRLSMAIRILVHDTNDSHSLLQILGIKKSLQYFSYLEPTDHTDTLSFVGLSMGFTEKGLRYYPMNGEPQYRISFDDWWNQKVMINKKARMDISRKNVILDVAHKDGGAHIDPILNNRFAKLSRLNGFGWQTETLTESGIIKSDVVANGPELSIIRQSAYELYLTLNTELENIK
ncbi:hypothetical protein J7E52_10710 [Bacillus sp. ISL-34]|uniref:hypothetical protein n=1 Tax=Bacillus sp. ISL-34 TaxID=2819121 RepID=UPI001BEA9D18|nr:hypothetical protein [Bacillus sp. ISL-34]MBT2647187.1 hypothetical protein [Bacillus sp. ISL-34]